MLIAQAAAAREVLVLAGTLLAHILGATALIYTLIRADDNPRGDWWPRDDRGDDPPAEGPPVPSGGGHPLPLPVSRPSAVRLRRPARLGDAYEHPPRRSPHPARPQTPTPARHGH
jgi:hypothetical protein